MASVDSHIIEFFKHKANQILFLQNICDDPLKRLKEPVDEMIFYILSNTDDTFVRRLALIAMKSWLRMGGFQQLHSHDCIDPFRRARVLAFVQFNGDDYSDKFRLSSSAIHENGDASASKRRKISEEREGPMIDEEEDHTRDRGSFNPRPWIDDILSSSDDYRNLSKDQTPVEAPAAKKSMNSHAIYQRDHVNKPMNSLHESIGNRIKMSERKSPSLVADIANALLELQNYQDKDIIQSLDSMALELLCDDVTLAVAESLIESKRPNETISHFTIGCLLRRVRSLKAPASRMLLRSVDVLYKHNPELILACFISRILQSAISGNDISKSNVISFPNQYQIELVQRFAKQCVARDQFDSLLCHLMDDGNASAFTALRSLDDLKSNYIMLWTNDIAKLVNSLLLSRSSVSSTVGRAIISSIDGFIDKVIVSDEAFLQECISSENMTALIRAIQSRCEDQLTVDSKASLRRINLLLENRRR